MQSSPYKGLLLARRTARVTVTPTVLSKPGSDPLGITLAILPVDAKLSDARFSLSFNLWVYPSYVETPCPDEVVIPAGKRALLWAGSREQNATDAAFQHACVLRDDRVMIESVVLRPDKESKKPTLRYIRELPAGANTPPKPGFFVLTAGFSYDFDLTFAKGSSIAKFIVEDKFTVKFLDNSSDFLASPLLTLRKNEFLSPGMTEPPLRTADPDPDLVTIRAVSRAPASSSSSSPLPGTTSRAQPPPSRAPVPLFPAATSSSSSLPSSPSSPLINPSPARVPSRNTVSFIKTRVLLLARPGCRDLHRDEKSHSSVIDGLTAYARQCLEVGSEVEMVADSKLSCKTVTSKVLGLFQTEPVAQQYIIMYSGPGVRSTMGTNGGIRLCDGNISMCHILQLWIFSKPRLAGARLVLYFDSCYSECIGLAARSCLDGIHMNSQVTVRTFQGAHEKSSDRAFARHYIDFVTKKIPNMASLGYTPREFLPGEQLPQAQSAPAAAASSSSSSSSSATAAASTGAKTGPAIPK